MIYCVEDDDSILDIELYTLQSTGFEAKGFPDAASFFDALQGDMPELVILDIMLPGMDGVEVLQRLKQSPSTRELPVIMATAKGKEYDKIKSLDLGADDYLVKPFGMMEMISRVKAVLRRCAPKAAYKRICAGALVIDTDEHTVTVDGKRVDLTLKEYELLRLFAAHPGMVYTRDQLLQEVWQMEYIAETRTVDVHIRTLRTKLGVSGNLIETVRGVGYRMGKTV